MQGLTTGRIVHYCTRLEPHRAAIVVGVEDDDGLATLATLYVFPNMPTFIGGGEGGDVLQHVLYSDTLTIGTWHWVEPA